MDISISPTLEAAYNEQYSDDTTKWRELGGKFKADNIIDVCRGYQFSKVLECGAGEGSILKFLDEKKIFNDLFAIEISDSGISQIHKRNIHSLTEVKKFDGYSIPYPDNFFDMAYCSHVLEHVEYPRLLLREMKRVSTYQIFEVPLDYSIDVDLKVEHFLSYGHINIFTPSLFAFLLKSEGYEIISEKLTHTPIEVLNYMNSKKQNSYRFKFNSFSLILMKLIQKITGKLFRKIGREFGFSSYTCLSKGIGELKIF